MLIPQSFDDEIAAHKSRGYLQEVRPESLPVELMKIGDLASIRLFVLSCCDGHQFLDITRHTQTCWNAAKQTLGIKEITEDCLHWRTENGGPFALSHKKLTTQYFRGDPVPVDKSILLTMEKGMRLKGIPVVLHIGHSVCGMVKDDFDSIAAYEDHLVIAKDRVMKELGLGRSQVISWLQVHRSIGRRTHHLDCSLIRERGSLLKVA